MHTHTFVKDTNLILGCAPPVRKQRLMEDNVNDTGALGPSGRFARMEAALDRIESKLDLKADVSLVAALEARMVLFETKLTGLLTGTNLSPRSEAFIARFEKLEKVVDKMEDDEEIRKGILESAKKTADEKYDRLMWIVGLVTIINLLVNIFPTEWI